MIYEVDDAKWTEMAHRQCMLQLARDRDATHIALIDADEILTGNLLPQIRFMIETTPPGTVLQLPWLALPRLIYRYITEGIWGKGQQISFAFQDQPDFGWHARGPEEYDFHHRHPMGSRQHPIADPLTSGET